MLTWILCIVIAIIFLGVTLKYLFNQQKHRMGMAFIMLMCTGFFAYFPYYIAEYDFLNAVICDIVNLMQIVTLNSNSYETSQPDIANPIVFYAVIIIRGAVHLASPMVFAAATYTFITEKLENWNTNRVIRKKKKIYVFSFYNEKTQKIAMSIAQKHSDSTSLIFYETERISDDLRGVLGKNGVAHISHKMRLDVQTQKLPKVDLEKSELYFILLNNSDENIDLGLELESYYRERYTFNDRLHIIAFSDNNASDENVIDSIDTALDFRVINENRMFTYDLLTEHPLYEAVRDGELSVLISGYNLLAQEILMAVLSCGQMPGVRLKVTLISENTTQIREYLNLYYPEILNSDYDIKLLEASPRSSKYTELLQTHHVNPGYIVLCEENDNNNVQTAVMLRRFFLTHNNEFTDMPIINVRQQSHKKSSVLQKSDFRINPFGCDDKIYSYFEIVDPELEALAKRVHFAYYEMPEQPTHESALKTLQSYYNLEYNRKSSLAMALSIRYKLHQMGFRMERSEEPDVAVLQEFLDNSDIEKYCEAEHRRWMTYMRTEGNRVMTVSQAETIAHKAPQLLKKLGNSVYMGMHMDIVPFYEISEKTKDINNRCKDLDIKPKEDTFNKDDVIIKALPGILGNSSWQAETGGYVYKVVPETESKYLRQCRIISG